MRLDFTEHNIKHTLYDTGPVIKKFPVWHKTLKYNYKLQQLTSQKWDNSDKGMWIFLPKFSCIYQSKGNYHNNMDYVSLFQP